MGLLGEGLGPGEFFCLSRFPGGRLVCNAEGALAGGLACRVLKFGAEPADRLARRVKACPSTAWGFGGYRALSGFLTPQSQLSLRARFVFPHPTHVHVAVGGDGLSPNAFPPAFCAIFLVCMNDLTKFVLEFIGMVILSRSVAWHLVSPTRRPSPWITRVRNGSLSPDLTAHDPTDKSLSQKQMKK